MEDERNEYNGCGFGEKYGWKVNLFSTLVRDKSSLYIYNFFSEIPDILNKTHLEALRKWTGELRYLQNIPLVRYSKTYLLGNDEKL